MIITRWQASIIPTKEQVLTMFQNEGLEPHEDVVTPQQSISDFTKPFHEILMVVEGELLITISGNQLLLRAGDRIRVPAHTKQSKKNSSPQNCVYIYSYTAF